MMFMGEIIIYFRRKKSRPRTALNTFLVEMAGLEPASASTPL